MERIKSLDNFLKTSWNHLFRAAYTRKGDFQKGIIATVNGGQQASVRIVILREASAQNRQLLFFTDIRSPKVQEMKLHPDVSWLFWDDSRKLQIRMRGKVAFHTQDEHSRKLWDKLPTAARKSYATVSPPSSTIEEDTENLPQGWNNFSEEQAEQFYPNFLLVVTTIEQIQCLHLHPQGHQHARFDWEEDQWKGSWLVP